MAGILAKLALIGLAAATAVGVPSDDCEGDTCKAGEDTSLLQAIHSHIKETEVEVRCSYFNSDSFPGVPAKQCTPSENACCTGIGRNYACPGTAPNSQCNVTEGPNKNTFVEGKPLLPIQPQPAVSFANSLPEFPAPFTPYEPVLTNGQTLEAFMKQYKGIKNVTDMGGPGGALWEKIFTNDTGSFFKQHGIESLWGDLGSIWQPGFGGIRTINLLHLTVEPGFKLYHMWGPVRAGANYLCFPCSVWWAPAETYSANLNESSVRVATTSDYGNVTECEMNTEFDVIVGQGWNIDKFGCVNRKSCDPATFNATSGKVASYFEEQGFPIADDRFVQFVVPACEMATKCRTTQLCKSNVAGSFKQCDGFQSSAVDAPSKTSGSVTDPDVCGKPVRVGGALGDFGVVGLDPAAFDAISHR